MNNLEQIALSTLKDRLRSGAIRYGQVISENALAKEIGISRTPVRHALRQLASQGVLIQVPHVGAVVPIPRREEIDEIFHVREMIEAEAAALAASNASDDQRRQLRLGAIQYYLQARSIRVLGPESLEGDRQVRLDRVDLQFHALLLEASGNRQLARLASEIELQTRTRTADMQGDVDWEAVKQKLSRVSLEHFAIARAVYRGDSQTARQAMVEHIRRGKDSFIALMESARAHGGSAKLPPAVRMLLEQHERSSSKALRFE